MAALWAVQTPSRLTIDGQDNNSNREDGRRSARDRSDSERNRSEEFVRRGSRVQDVTPGPSLDQGQQNSERERRGRDESNESDREPGRRGSRVQEATPGPQFNQGQQNSNREGRDGTAVRIRVGFGRVEGAVRACRRPLRFADRPRATELKSGRPGRVRREDRNRDSSESVRRGSRVQGATPGPQFEQGEEQNRSRQRGNRRDDAGESRTAPKPSRNLYQDSSPRRRVMWRSEDTVRITIPEEQTVPRHRRIETTPVLSNSSTRRLRRRALQVSR